MRYDTVYNFSQCIVKQKGVLNIMCAWLLQSCPTLCDPIDCSPPGSSVHRILQAGILEWVAMPSFKRSS